MMLLFPTVHVIIFEDTENYRLNLFFDQAPTDSQLVEATICMLTELDNCSPETGLAIVEAAKQGLPMKGRRKKFKNTTIIHTTHFIFHVSRDEELQ